MNILWYKKFFSIIIRYQSGAGYSSSGLRVEPCHSTKVHLDSHKIKYKLNPGRIDLFVQSTQEAGSPNLVPMFPLDDTTYLFFQLIFEDEALLRKLKLFPDISSQELGFPMLLTGIKTNASIDPVVMQYEKIRVLPGVSSISVKASEANLVAVTYTTFKVKGPDGKVKYTSTAYKNGDGNFHCSMELNSLQQGIYTLEIGALSKKIFIDTSGELTGCNALIQITRNDKIKYPATMTTNASTVFNYTILKV